MPSVIVEKPYKFVPPHRGNWWPTFIQTFRLFDKHLAKKDGVVDYELRNPELLIDSLAAGHGILLAPNHCRYADPLAIGWLARRANTHVFAMASWHLFNMGAFNAFATRKMGGFSIFREGTDKKSIDTAIDALVEAQRPLVLFAEGATFRANDLLQPLMDGTSLISRTAARRRAKRDSGKVVVHPVAMKYIFQGDIKTWAHESLNRLETALSWQVREEKTILDRIGDVGNAILALKEVEYLGAAQEGDHYQRRRSLTSTILQQVESRCSQVDTDASVFNRVRTLRTELLPKLIESQDESDKQPMRRDLRSLDLAQQLDSFPENYLASDCLTDTRVLETLENMEEGLFGKSRWPGPLKVIIEVAEAIEVPASRVPKGQQDPVLQELALTLQDRLGKLSREANPFDPAIC